MSNLTIAVDEEVVRRARVRAIQEGTSVSAQLRTFLDAYAAGQPVPSAAKAPATSPPLAAAKTIASEPLPPAYLCAQPEAASAALPQWLSQLRERVEEFGGIEPAEWLLPRAQSSGRDTAPGGL